MNCKNYVFDSFKQKMKSLRVTVKAFLFSLLVPNWYN